MQYVLSASSLTFPSLEDDPIIFEKCFSLIYSRLLRCSIAMGSSTGLVPVGPAKVKAQKSILLTESTPDVKLKNT